MPDAELRLQLLLRRQEHALAHHVVEVVEEPVDRLEAEVRHPDEVGVGKRERDAQPAAVRLADVADFARENVARAFALLPGFIECAADSIGRSRHADGRSPRQRGDACADSVDLRSTRAAGIPPRP